MVGSSRCSTRPMAGAVCRICMRALSVLLQALCVAPFLLLGFWVLVAGTRRWRLDEYWKSFPPTFGCDDKDLLDTCTTQLLLYFWLAPSIAALAALWAVFVRGKLGVHTHQQHSCTGPTTAPAIWREALVPPKRFWTWWCGGVTAADAVAVSLWLSINALWAVVILRRYFSLIPIFSGTGTPLWILEIELVAVGLGSLLFPNLVLLFYPISRGSIVLQATGLSYPEGIKYHRWLGHFVMYVVTAHSLGFWATWLAQHIWLQEVFKQGDRVNNLMGGISFLGGLALWLTSLEGPRRANYNLFYVVHHLGWWTFFLCGVMHYSPMLWYFLPGLLLYGVDAAFRVHQAMFDRSANVVSAMTDGCKEPGVVALQLSCPKYCLAQTGFLWLNVPSISAHQWHPFEYIAVHPGPAATFKPVALLHIKCYNRWTKALGDLVRNLEQAGSATTGGDGAKQCLQKALKVRLEGPYGEVCHPHIPDEPNHGLVFVAGGIGIAAALSVLAELPDRPGSSPNHSSSSSGSAVCATADDHAAAAGPAPKQQQLLLVWSCRHAGELLLLAPPLLALAARKGVQVTWQLHYTGSQDHLAAAIADSVTAHLHNSSNPVAAELAAGGGGAAGTVAAGSGDPGMSSMCPVLALKQSFCQAFHKTAVHLAVFAAALAVLLLVRGHSLVWADRQWTTGQMGLAYVVGLTVCCVGAGLLVVSFGQLGLWVQSQSADSADREEQTSVEQPLLGAAADKSAAPGAAAAAPTSRAVLLQGAAGVQVSVPGFEPVQVTLGRPHLAGALQQWLLSATKAPTKASAADDEELGGCACAALPAGAPSSKGIPAGCLAAATVYGMGPGGLLSATRLLVDELNGSSGCPVPLRYEQRTHEL